ncbi:diguanylate cyclase [Pseudomonas sp. 5P_3.1_Bac2]|uniref:GGDEF domain-containing protein n=1 Tax=Pseudomonas sp. 5P_3.1_Bac2 TaxID=2971617 RepID=UPI0021C9EC9F|nr:diguanylate cyclase [Pseudomonas sp. 5P_3.1_Bac2]MCU1716496.1 GGDEF domain-containing protein [Pseudomonas sp. 5P_3.1_Bac2]
MLPPIILPHDIDSSPYAEQLSVGFRRLRFSEPLEREYHDYQSNESFELRRISLCMGIVAWLAFGGFDFVLLSAEQLHWMLTVRSIGLAIIVGLTVLAFQRRFIRQLPLFSLLALLTLGAASAYLVAHAHRYDPSYPYEGLLLVCMAGYFLAGLRLPQALGCSMLVLLMYVVLEVLVGKVSRAMLFNSMMFLLVGNLMGAVGCYLLEYKSREHFLVNRIMRMLAESDSLTGLRNRRSFNRQFDSLYRQAQREHCNIALLLCDLDHFKAYNDHYGHQLGDKALQTIGNLLQQAARRPLDMAVRLGGEEFAVLLYDISVNEARNHAEALRLTLQEMQIEHRGSSTANVLTMSIGVACAEPGEEGGALSRLYEIADRALYEAKAFGRNQVGF